MTIRDGSAGSVQHSGQRGRKLRCRLHWHAFALRTNADGEQYRECVYCQHDRDVYDLFGSVALSSPSVGLAGHVTRAGRRAS